MRSSWFICLAIHPLSQQVSVGCRGQSAIAGYTGVSTPKTKPLLFYGMEEIYWTRLFETGECSRLPRQWAREREMRGAEGGVVSWLKSTFRGNLCPESHIVSISQQSTGVGRAGWGLKKKLCLSQNVTSITTTNITQTSALRVINGLLQILSFPVKEPICVTIPAKGTHLLAGWLEF